MTSTGGARPGASPTKTFSTRCPLLRGPRVEFLSRLCVLPQRVETHRKWMRRRRPLISSINRLLSNIWALKLLSHFGKALWKLLISFSKSFKEGTDPWPLLSSLLNPVIYSLLLHKQTSFATIHSSKSHTFKFSTIFWTTLLWKWSLHVGPVSQTFSSLTIHKPAGWFQSRTTQR